MPIDIKTPVQSLERPLLLLEDRKIAGLQGVELVRHYEKKISPSPLCKIVEIVLSEKNFVMPEKLFRAFRAQYINGKAQAAGLQGIKLVKHYEEKLKKTLA